jgi:hypothetical protein
MEHPYFSETPLPQTIEMMRTFPSLHDQDLRYDLQTRHLV